MAKLTERDVFEALRNLDTSFLDDYKPYNDDYATTIKFHEGKRTSESNYFNAAGKVQKAIDKCLIREKSNFVRHDGDLEGDNLYNYDLYIAGVNVSHITDIEYYEYPLKKKIEYAQEFVKEFKQNYEKNKKRLEELTASPEIAEYNNLINVLDKIDNKGFFGRLTEESKIRQIRKRLEELKKYVDDYNNLKKYVKDYKDGDVVVENLPKLIEAIRERDAMYDVYRIYHNENRFNDSKEYLDYQNAKKQVSKRESNAKDFKIVKFYREHEAEFANTSKTLIMIYQEILGERYLENFKDMLVAYNQAGVIAKKEGKDFNALQESEQFGYFEAAQKVVEANNKFNAHKEGGGKE